ncbi:MAG: hypothetical protein ACRC67_45175 [Inquilinus sp.]|uniref:hypothetical protein n=1 Tax=Inquilinus sp. TaxID=1932117 RepID=UPI003F41504B
MALPTECRSTKEKSKDGSTDMDTAYISALSALAGSAIGAMASFATTWLTQRHQDHADRLSKEASRRERLFGEFIEQASKIYGDALLLDHLDDPAKLVPVYATLNKLRLFATPRSIAAAEAVLDRLLETYALPPDELKEPAWDKETHDILRDFTQFCRAELIG